MVCAACSSEMSASTRFCPQCGNPGETPARPSADGRHVSAAVGAGPPPGPPTQVLEAPVEPRTPAPTTATDSQPAVEAIPRGPSVAERLTTAFEPVRRYVADSGLEIQLALVGTALVLLAFFFLPFMTELGTAAEIGGRVWWRPITAVTATVLLVLALRRELPPSGAQARVVSALALAAAGAAEAGLLGLVTGNGRGLRAGYHVMLLGMVIVLVAAFLATRHPVRRLVTDD